MLKMIDSMTSELENAIEEHNTKLVMEFLKKGANPDGDPIYPLLKTAVDELFEKGSIDILKLLLEYGASVNYGYVRGVSNSILNSAICSSCYIEVITLLLSYGANPIVIDEEGSSPLDDAVYEKRLDIVFILLEYGAKSDINKYHHFTVMTVLERAVRDSGLTMIKLLLDNGADTTVPTEFNDLMIVVLNDDLAINTINYTDEEPPKPKQSPIPKTRRKRRRQIHHL